MGSFIAVSERKLKDFIVFGTHAQQHETVRALCRAFDDLCAWSERRSERTPLVVALRKLLDAANRSAKLAFLHIDGETPIEVLALAARNMFELGLRVRHVLLSSEYLQRWSAETVAGRIDLYEGLISGMGREEERVKIILTEIETQRDWAAKRGVAVLPKKAMPTRELAKAVGSEEEYVAFYRMYSKLVHPSGYSVNYPREDVDSWVNRDAMLIKRQQYGMDLLERTRVGLGAPKDVITPPKPLPN